MGEATVHALNNVSVDFEQGKFTAIMGPSGSGKSTLMQTIATLDTPDPNPATSIRIGGTELFGLKDNALTEFRREHIGFIFQAFNLVPTLDAGENMTLPLALAGRRPDPEWLATVVSIVGLGDRLRHRPAELSGGQQQRVAVARALVSRPELVFADEPTGNLDSRTGREVLQVLQSAARSYGQSIAMVTHDPIAASYADRVIFLGDGRVVADRVRMEASEIAAFMRSIEQVA